MKNNDAQSDTDTGDLVVGEIDASKVDLSELPDPPTVEELNEVSEDQAQQQLADLPDGVAQQGEDHPYDPAGDPDAQPQGSVVPAPADPQGDRVQRATPAELEQRLTGQRATAVLDPGSPRTATT